MGMTYKDSGVDIDAGDQWTEHIGALARKTFSPRVLPMPGGFAGLFRLDYDEQLFRKNYRKPVMLACTDGVGTKICVARTAGVYNTIGIDLVAMNVNDLIVHGAEPLFFLDYLAVGQLDPEQLIRLAEGIAEGCRQAGCALLGGETAEMPDLYDQDECDMAGFAVGVAELNRLINGSQIEPGDSIIGLASDGLHSNGYSLARKVCFDRQKLKVDQFVADLNCTIGQELLKPTRIYVKPVISVLHRYKVKRVVTGMAHITGGGLPGNVVRVLPANCNAVIRRNSWPNLPIFTYIQRAGPVDEQEMYRVYNMGIGFVMVVKPAFTDSVMSQLAKLGETPYLIGRIKKGTGKVEMR